MRKRRWFELPGLGIPVPEPGEEWSQVYGPVRSATILGCGCLAGVITFIVAIGVLVSFDPFGAARSEPGGFLVFGLSFAAAVVIGGLVVSAVARRLTRRP